MASMVVLNSKEYVNDPPLPPSAKAGPPTAPTLAPFLVWRPVCSASVTLSSDRFTFCQIMKPPFLNCVCNSLQKWTNHMRKLCPILKCIWREIGVFDLPSIISVYCLAGAQLQGAGSNPSWQRARGGVHCGLVTKQSRLIPPPAPTPPHPTGDTHTSKTPNRQDKTEIKTS